jgi:hypothetical protein
MVYWQRQQQMEQRRMSAPANTARAMCALWLFEMALLEIISEEPMLASLENQRQTNVCIGCISNSNRNF